jgi:hypothetical protein
MLRRSVGLVVAVLLVAPSSAGCGAAGEANPEKIGPRGVDELVIPTPSPDADDFVQQVDNPLLPLAPGTVWTYDVAGSAVQRVEMRVEERHESVAGISCVVVHRTAYDRDGAKIQESETFYAQDAAGNVWLFGERPVVASVDSSRSWMAGVDGAQAGIAMLATPRVGDGYLQQLAPGAADRATVLALDEERTVPAGTFGGLLLTEDTSTLPTSDELVVRRAYAAGTGLMEETTMVGGTQRLVLASVVAP